MDKPSLRSMVLALSLLTPCLAGPDPNVIYDTNFSSDPGWVTDQPGKYYWDAASQTYHVRSENKAPALGLNRYFYKLLAEPVGSFVLQWDVKITYEDWSCGLAFGLWDNTFSDLSLPGGQTIYFVSGISDAGKCMTLVVKGPGGTTAANAPTNAYSLNQWYTIVLSYDAVANTVDCKVTIRDTGATVWTANTLSVPGGSFTTDLRYLGGTRRTGYNGTYPGLSQWAVAEGNIDNVVLRVPTLPPPCEITVVWQANPDGSGVVTNNNSISRVKLTPDNKYVMVFHYNGGADGIPTRVDKLAASTGDFVWPLPGYKTVTKPGQRLSLNGWVDCNGNLWIMSSWSGYTIWKYDSELDTELCSYTGGSGFEYVVDAIDDCEYLYVAGMTGSGSNEGSRLVKLRLSDCSLICTCVSKNTSQKDDYGLGIALDSSKNVFRVGMDSNPGEGVPFRGRLIGHNASNGAEFLNYTVNETNSSISGITIDSNDYIYIAYSYGYTPSGQERTVVQKLERVGSTANVVWEYRFADIGMYLCHDAIVKHTGNSFYVAFNQRQDGTTVPGIAEFDLDGNLLWKDTIDRPGWNLDSGIDANGNDVYVGLTSNADPSKTQVLCLRICEPVAYWSFDNPSDPGHDDSGNGHHGTIYGATWVADGKIGGALQFDGSGDYVGIPDHPSQTGMSNLTIEAWILPEDTVLPPEGYHMVVVGKWGPGGYSDDSYNLVLNREGAVLKVGFNVSDGTEAGTIRLNPNYVIPFDRWTHVMGVYDGLKCRIYVDGTEVGVSDKQVPGLVIQNTSVPLQIGMARMDSSGNYNEFCGKIDEVKLWCGAREPEPVPEWSFVQITDTHIGYGSDRDKATTNLRAAIRQINRMQPKPELVLVTGDIVECGCHEGWLCNSLLYTSFKNTMATLDSEIEYSTVPGNHDHLLRRSCNCYSDSLGSGDYGFTKSGFLFIGLDTGTSLSGPGSGLEEWQIGLCKIAGQGSMNTPKVVFMHHPGVDFKGDDQSLLSHQKDFLDWCDGNSVRLVLAGHTHQSSVTDREGADPASWGKPWPKPVFVQTPSCTKRWGDDEPIGLRVVDVKGDYAYPRDVTPIDMSNALDVENHSPTHVHVFDSHGGHVGIASDGKPEQGIPDSFYRPHMEMPGGDPNYSLPEKIVIFDPCDQYLFRQVGQSVGTYRLVISMTRNGIETVFEASDIPTSPGAIHDYVVDWEAIANGQPGVTVYVDKDGDGDTNMTFTAGSELTAEDFAVGVSAEGATNIGRTSAMLWGRVNGEQGKRWMCRFYCYKEGKPIGMSRVTPWMHDITSGEMFSQKVEGLDPCTKYVFYVETRIEGTTGSLRSRLEGFATLCNTVDVKTPNGGECWLVGSVQKIVWGAEPTVEWIVLEYSLDGGATWVGIATLPNVEGYKKYRWMVPDEESSQCLVRISDVKDPNISDVSDAFFCITKHVVPRMTGTFVEDAKAALLAAGLTAGSITERYTNTVPCGTVMYQTVEAGTPLPAGSRVDLIVACGWHGTGGPTMQTESATEVGSTSARLWGAVIDDDGEWCRYRFCYQQDGGGLGTGNVTSWAGYAKKDQSFSQVVTGLKPNTKYRFCVESTNSTGTAHSGWKTFTTLPLIPE